MKSRLFLLSLLAMAACSGGPEDGTYHLELLTTNDVHGRWFDESYVDGSQKNSLFAVKHYVDSVRKAAGAENVILVDAGDCLQGDNAAYYFNYVDTVSPHLYPRIVEYMGYNAIAVGNHDIETGHPVYDRITAEMKRRGIPFLAGNAIRIDNGKPYFDTYTIVKNSGLKVAILGFTNPNIKGWLSEELWSGMTFESLIPLVQQEVDRVTAAEKPHIVIVAVHSGSGNGDGSMYESQGLDLFKSLRGVDFVVASHDHRALTQAADSIGFINSGSHARNIGHGTIDMTVKDGRIVSKTIGTGLINVKASNADEAMKAEFRKDFEAVKAFTLRTVGELKSELRTRDAYIGMSDYINLIHTLGLDRTGADISFAAPLTYNGTVSAGTLVYNDLFTIYPFENQLFTLRMTGREVKDYLEYSYEQWINTVDFKDSGIHVLKIRKGDDMRFNQSRWSFVNRSYNFDSAAGINYTVDVTKPFGSRVSISSMADGNGFDMDKEYTVAMTSYRASGGGKILEEGAGIKDSETRTVGRYPELRNILYDYLQANGAIDPEKTGDTSVLGHWEFIPADKAKAAIAKDMLLLFGDIQ